MKPEISRKLADQIVQAVYEVCGYPVNFIDCQGYIYASTEEQRVGCYHEIGKKAAETQKTIEVTDSDSYKGTLQGVNLPVFYHQRVIAVVGISGPPEMVRKYAHLAETMTLLLIREQELQYTARTHKEKCSFLIRTLLEGTGTDQLEEELEGYGIFADQQVRILFFTVFSKVGFQRQTTEYEAKIQQFLEKQQFSLFAYQYPRTYIGILTDIQYKAGLASIKEFARQQEGMIKIVSGKSGSLSQISYSYETCKMIQKSSLLKEYAFASYEDLTFELLFYRAKLKEKQDFWEKILGSVLLL